MQTQRRINPALARKYTDLHEGRPPDAFIAEKLGPQPKYFIELGKIPEQMYLKKVVDGEFPYRHPYAEWAMPTLVHDERGKLHIIDQDGLIVTERGIEDNMARKHARKSRHITRVNPRSNPLNAEAAKKVAMSAGVVGGIAAGTALLMEYGLAHGGSMLSGLNGYKKAGVQAGVGILVALGLQSIGQEVLAAGIGIGGVSTGLLNAVHQYQGTMAPAPIAAPAPVSAPAPAPGAGVFYPRVASR